MTQRLAFLGDVVGAPGCHAVRQLLPAIRERFAPEAVIANAENAAQGSGLTPDLYERLRGAGLDAMTLGDHVYKRGQIIPVLERATDLARPGNLPAAAKGRRWLRVPFGERSLFVITLLGRRFMELPVDDPFATIDRLIGALPEPAPIVVVEVHAETTSEKQALRWHLDGRVAAVVGTHTHVATADAAISANGTAAITDLGMCGPHQSVIGRRADRVIKHLTTGMPVTFDVAEGDPRVCGIVVDIDSESGRAVGLERLEMSADPAAPPFISRGR